MKNNVNEGRNTRARRQKPDGFVLILCYRLHSIQTLAQVANISTFSRSRCPHLLCLDAPAQCFSKFVRLPATGKYEGRAMAQ